MDKEEIELISNKFFFRGQTTNDSGATYPKKYSQRR